MRYIRLRSWDLPFWVGSRAPGGSARGASSHSAELRSGCSGSPPLRAAAVPGQPGRPTDRQERPDPAGAARGRGGKQRTESRPCRWWGWTWARRAATSRWPGPGASRPSPTSSATGAPRKWTLRGRWAGRGGGRRGGGVGGAAHPRGSGHGCRLRSTVPATCREVSPGFTAPRESSRLGSALGAGLRPRPRLGSLRGRRPPAPSEAAPVPHPPPPAGPPPSERVFAHRRARLPSLCFRIVNLEMNWKLLEPGCRCSSSAQADCC